MTTASSTLPSVVGHALPHPTSVDMIKNKEDILLFPTTGTNPAIGFYSCKLQSLVPISPGGVTVVPLLLSVLLDPLSASCPGILALGRTPARSTVRNWLTRSVIEVSFWLKYLALGTLLHKRKLTWMEAWEQAYKMERGLV